MWRVTIYYVPHYNPEVFIVLDTFKTLERFLGKIGRMNPDNIVRITWRKLHAKKV